MTNADRRTPHEYETTDALIAEVRRLRADNIAPQSSRNRLVALTEQLADALEAAMAQVARLQAKVNETLQLMAEPPVDGIDAVIEMTCNFCDGIANLTRRGLLTTADHDPCWPADLLEAMRFLVRFGYLNNEVRGTLQRYGLIEKEAVSG